METSADTRALLRAIPKVDELLKRPEIAQLLSEHPRVVVLEAVRDAVEAVRARVLAGSSADVSEAAIAADASLRAELKSRRSLRRVINATGVIVHTNLGRSVLSAEAIGAVVDAAGGYSTLEYDVESGERGSRHVHVERLLCTLTGAEAAMAVNNNAAAVMLGIAGLARGKEAVVSRGQLVEIGGSFRIPDIMAESGARMVEVGTTNKTHLADYESAITDQTALLLKVHSSNFRVVGFAEEVSLAELVALGDARGIPVFEDQGSGALVDVRRFGISYEPTIGEAVATGASLVSCSGDKLLGGPQAGILVGRADVISRLKKHPMARALRLDKMTLAALEVTLRAYLDPDRAVGEVPTLRMLAASADEVGARAREMAARITEGAGAAVQAEVIADVSRAGGGALPLADIPTFVLALSPRTMTEVELEERLRLGDPAVVVRVREDRVLIDPRTLTEDEARTVTERVIATLAGDE